MAENDVIMYAYKNASEGATMVAYEMDILKMKHEGSTWTPRFGRTIINWGSGEFPRESMFRSRVINHPDAVMGVIDKRKFFQKTVLPKGPRTPLFTTSQEAAQNWLRQGNTVVARTLLEGAQGAGIKMMKKLLDFVAAPLYTLYIDKDYEFRVHVIAGKVVAVQQRLRDVEQDGDEPEDQWVINRPRAPADDVLEQSIKAVKCAGLDFGAVDILQKDNLGYVLEVNSAPWMNKVLAKTYCKHLQELVAA